MKLFNLENMVRGWVVGNFDPSVLKTENFEVGIKDYKAGDCEESHYHKESTEITIVVLGNVEMNGQRYKTNDIIVIEPGESTDFKALTYAVTCVIRDKSIPGDKYSK